MARKRTITKEAKDIITKPDWYQRMCEEVVVQEGSGNSRQLHKLIDFKGDTTVQELFTKDEITNHLKGIYIDTLKDLKNPIALVAKEMVDLRVAIEKQRLIETSRKDSGRGDDDIISPTMLKYYTVMHDLMKEINKYTLKTKKEVNVKHSFHDETDGALEGNWGNVVDVTPEEDEQ